MPLEKLTPAVMRSIFPSWTLRKTDPDSVDVKFQPDPNCPSGTCGMGIWRIALEGYERGPWRPFREINYRHKHAKPGNPLKMLADQWQPPIQRFARRESGVGKLSATTNPKKGKFRVDKKVGA